jgi:hypothetical protein
MSREFDMVDLEDFLKRSTALMVLRRLLWNAEWYQTRFVHDEISIMRFEKDYLLGVYGFGPEGRRELGILVFKAVEASKKDIPPGLWNRLREQASRLNTRCQLGGCEIDYDADNPPPQQSFSLDHIWPQSLGGSSEIQNLRVACRDCNSKRQNLAEPCDAHYEHFHVKTERSGGNFLSELDKNFRMAALLRADFRCQMCDKPVDIMEGGLDFLQEKRDENYHMFNILVACRSHRS